MAEHCAFGGHSLVIHFDVEFISRKISAQRPAHLHSAQRLAHIWPAAKAFNKFTQGDTECFFDNSALIEIATQLEWHRAARTPHAVILIGLCTLGHDERYGSKNGQTHAQICRHALLACRWVLHHCKAIGLNPMRPVSQKKRLQKWV